jgi:glycosyltransferase involved in cell wall biosynthesis
MSLYDVPAYMNASRNRTVALALIVRTEQTGVRVILPKIRLNAFDQYLAIDGNSEDDTVAALESFGVPTFRQRERGLGAAMLEARARVTTDALIFFHPDGNEDPDDLEKIAALLRAGKDFVVASRMIPGSTNEEDDCVLKWRKWANKGFAALANMFFASGQNRTTDVTNGFRGTTCTAWDRMNLSSHDLTMDYQMVIRALKLGIPITEFPTHEGPRISGVTKFASLSTGIAELKLLWRELRMGRRKVNRAQVGFISKPERLIGKS